MGFVTQEFDFKICDKKNKEPGSGSLIEAGTVKKIR